MSDVDETLWPAPEPPDGFADRVMLAIEEDETKRRRRRAMAASGLVVTLAAAAAAFVWMRAAPRPVVVEAPREGELTADDRREIALFPGVRAVVERAAHLAWSASGVVQDRGDVFYRLDPGVHLAVSTPAGAVASVGACSRVKVVPSEHGERPLVLVAVAQGEVEVTSGGDAVRLAAGRYARLDADRIRTDADDADGAIALALASDRVRTIVERADRHDPPPVPTSLPRAAAPARLPARPPPAPVTASAAPEPPRTVHVPPCVCRPDDAFCGCVE